jgi:cytochrome c oxidase subunit 4
VIGPRDLVRPTVVWLALLVLLAITICAALAPIGPIKAYISLAIAAIKAGLIVWVFMDLRAEGGFMRLVALAALAWLAIMLTLMAADFAARG